MYLQDSESFPLLMRTIHQAEDLCESAAHAAFYLGNGKTCCQAELNGVVSGTSQARYFLWRVGKALEDGYSDGAMWFEAPRKPSKAPLSKELAALLMSDLKRTVAKIKKAICCLADYRSCKGEILLLRKAKACILGCYYPLAQGYDCMLIDFTAANRNLQGKAKAC